MAIFSSVSLTHVMHPFLCFDVLKSVGASPGPLWVFSIGGHDFRVNPVVEHVVVFEYGDIVHGLLIPRGPECEHVGSASEHWPVMSVWRQVTAVPKLT